MKLLGIICALKSEQAPILRNMEFIEEISKAGMAFTRGKVNGQEIVTVVCGVGKVNAAVCTEIMIEVLGCTHIVNLGVAGGLAEDVYPLDIVAATDLVQHDVEVTAFGEKLGQIPNLDTFSFEADSHLLSILDRAALKNDISLHKGRIVSGDQFIANQEKVRFLIKEFEAVAVEMEGASIAHVCYLNEIPFLVIRSISDNANNGAGMDFEEFKVSASEITWNLINTFIELYRQA